jgi:hypothetical protein
MKPDKISHFLDCLSGCVLRLGTIAVVACAIRLAFQLMQHRP